MNNNQASAGSVERIYHVSDSLIQDCYQITNQTCPAEAMEICYRLRSDVEQNGHILYVFHGPRFPLGFLKGRIVNGNTAKIDWFFVDDAHRRRGIGARLLAVYTAICQEYNIKKLSLLSVPNPDTLAFYRKNGFVRAGASYLMSKSLER